MATKHVTVIVLRADRELWTGGPLQLRVRDLRQGLHLLQEASFPGNSNIIQVNLNLPFDAGQAYGLEVHADDHRPAFQIIRHRTFFREEGGHQIEVDNHIFRLMVIPNEPRSLDLNQGYEQLVAEGSPTVSGPEPWPRERFRDMSDAHKMAFLNIDAKVRDTRINGLPVRSFVQGVREVAPARLFLFVRPELKDLVAASSEFSSAPGHAGHPDSWKHKKFGTGNLQLSFADTTIPLPSDPTRRAYSVDADIDLERGLLHVAEWLDNELFHPGQQTDQTLIYALLFSQGIIPRYTLRPETDFA